MEILAEGQSRHHEVRIAAPVPPETSGLSQLWEPLMIRGNLDGGAHVQLAGLLQSWQPDAVLLHAGSPGEMAAATLLAARQTAAVLVEHAPEYFPRSRPWLDPLYRMLKLSGTAWVTVSRAGGTALERAWKMPPGTLRVIHSGVDLPPDVPPEEELQSWIQHHEVVAAFGAPVRNKGFDRFVELARSLRASHPSVRWLWVGGDRPRRVGEVQVWPWTDAVGWLVRRAACVVIPSRREGLPLVLLESWAAGAPVIASATGGIPEVLRHGENGLLVANDDPDGWRTGLHSILTDPELRSRLAAAGHRTWQEGFTATHMVSRYEALLGEIVR